MPTVVFSKGNNMENQDPAKQAEHYLGEDIRSGVYKTILSRRDTRGQFKPDPIPDDVLSRLLTAAHYAPSVGFMQPWSFLLIKSQEKKQQIHDLFKKAHDEAAEMFDADKRDVYKSLKLEGIMESPVNLVITCDRDRAGPVVVGRTHIKSMDLYSSVCAAQNLWLAARTEGIGVGWVSIFDQPRMQEVLGIPKRVVPIAYLCLGYVDHFYDKPELESAGWRPRLPIDELLHFDSWEGKPGIEDEGLLNAVREDQKAAQAGAFVETRLNEGVIKNTGPVPA